MPTTTLYTKTGSEAGTVDLPDTLFAATVNEAVMHQAVVAQLAGRRIGHGRYQDARRGRRRRRQAVSPEGHRPCPPGLAQRSALRGRRRRLRPASALLRAAAAQAHEAARAPGRADLQVRRRRDQGRRRTWPRRAIKTRSWSATSTRSRPPAASRGRVGQGREAGAVGPQPARRDDHPGGLAQHVDVLGADMLLITQPSLPTLAEVYA